VNRQSLPTDYFASIYRDNADPWNFEGSDYENRKYEASLTALPRPRYRAGFEAACSIGVLTSLLAPRCDHLLATDAAEAPLQRARERLWNRPGVAFRQGRIPEEWPPEMRDLIVLSEVLYYLSDEDITWVSRLVLSTLEPAGHLLMVHWRGTADPPFPQTGDAASEMLIAAAGPALRPLRQTTGPDYRIDVLERTEFPARPGERIPQRIR
jgi:trans-aconitate methyltransferase